MTTIRYSWQVERNTAMKVFSQLYVGMRPVEEGASVPLGFATPYEDNSAGRKRQQTVNSWAGGYHSTVNSPTKPTFKIVDNIPREGWKITDDVKRVYWGGGNVVWRVEDPLGYELEIESQNLMSIIQVVGIEAGGLIPGKCILGRSGGTNVLLHETCDEYKDSVKAAEALKSPKQLGKNDRVVGGVYRLVDGTVAAYLGKVQVCKIGHAEPRYHMAEFPALEGMVSNPQLKGVVNAYTYKLEPSEEYEALVRVDDSTRKMGNILRLYKKAPLVSYIELFENGVEVTNALLSSFDWQFASTSISFSRITSVTVEKITDPVVKLQPWTEAQYENALESIGRYMVNPHGYIWFGAWFKHHETAAIIGDEMVGLLANAGSNTHYVSGELAKVSLKSRATAFGMPLIIGDGCFTTFYETNEVSSVYSPKASVLPWNRYSSNYEKYPHEVKIIEIKDCVTKEEHLAFFKKLREDRALFNIITRNKTKD